MREAIPIEPAPTVYSGRAMSLRAACLPGSGPRPGGGAGDRGSGPAWSRRALLTRARLALAALLLMAAPAAARTLYWQSLEVEARLHSDGRLRVLERQWMVFTGDWNGGERSFRVFPGQELRLHGMRRIDPGSGESVVMRPGSLGRVDHYAWQGRHTLRWRSRLPTDPEFDRTAILYELDYTLVGVVQERGGVYWVDHDFAFPDRPGPIEELRVELEIDDPWSALPIPGVERSPGPGSELITLTRHGLAPGESALVDFGLQRAGSAGAGAVRRLFPRGPRLAIVAGLAALAGLLLFRFFAHERALGRYDPASVPPRPDRSWLEEHLFAMRPEVVGAVWDRRIGAAEVAAVLARLVAEGRLASSVRTEGRWFKRQILELELLADRSAFSDYERRLIDRLFFDGRHQTDTAAVRERYRSTGFSPAATISSGIRKRLRKLPGFGRRMPRPSPAVTMLLALAGLVCLVLEALARGIAAAGPVAGWIFVSFIPTLVFGYALARSYALRADRLWIPGALLLLALSTCVSICGWAIVADADRFLPGLGYAGLFGRLALALLPLALVNSVLNAARTRDREPAVRLRRQLVGLRRSLARELGRKEPRLEDAWLPYLLALGLDKKVDRWFRAFGGALGASSARGFRGSAASPAGAVSTWTGGGGAFGGAGATASWTAAAGTLAAGVARPGSGGSSGGSSGGGGGGGGSSGGGGGGGW